ncbi:NYN domain-containing protein [Lysobacter sp. ESA13C]|uniref:NYN domain-containing protein n=1 Tax=Lysobacter sp. ESA13C TaxID=2862676 RepID=UPI001CBE9446|nr:NYN domain-containing protein [Lysobacter sp. ESA13C]
MSASPSHLDGRVAVLVDCDNVSPEILDYALLMAAQFGRVVLRRGYGNSSTLGARWQDALVRQAFTPHLQFQYASGKNTADIALALDALEAMFDERAQTFCLVTSDSDFAYLCRKLRERGATVCIVGESKAPEALRNASDQFFEWIREPVEEGALGEVANGGRTKGDSATKLDGIRPEPPKPIVRRRPRFVVDAVELLAGAVPDGKVTLSALGLYLRRTDPAFSAQTYGHSGLLNMLKTYDLLSLKQEDGGHWSVTPKPAPNGSL